MFRKKLNLYKNTLVDTKKLIRDLREEFRVSEHLRRIIYSCYEENDMKKFMSQKENASNENLSQEFKLKDSKGIILDECSSFYVIRQFNLLKKFIVNNSIPYETPAAKKVPEGYRASMWPGSQEKASEFSDDEYNLNALEKFKGNKIKKRRVIDASKIMKILRECEEQTQFGYILNCKGIITMDHMKPKIPVEVCDEFNKDRVVECDFDKLKAKLKEKKDPKIHMMNINKNYASLENAC